VNTLLAVDIGGTKTLLELSSLQGEVIVEQKYDSQQYDSFDLLLGEFFAQKEIKHHGNDTEKQLARIQEKVELALAQARQMEL